MEQLVPWIDRALAAIAVAAILVGLALLADPIRRVVTAIFALVHTPMVRVYTVTMEAARTVWGWIGRQLADECEQPGDGPLYFIIGSVIYALLTVLFILCDFGMIVLTAEAMGFEVSQIELPLDTATLTAMTLVTSALFWGAVLFDLMGVTRLAPWRRSLGIAQRRIVMGVSVFFLLMAVAVGTAMAYWRGVAAFAVPEAMEPITLDGAFQNGVGLTTGAEDTSPGISPVTVPTMPASIDSGLPKPEVAIACQMGIAALSISASAFSAVGVVILAKFLALLCLSVASLMILPAAFLSWLCAVVVHLARVLVETLVDLLLAPGQRLLDFFQRRPARQNTTAERETRSTSEPQQEDRTDADEPDLTPDPGFNPFNPGRKP